MSYLESSLELSRYVGRRQFYIEPNMYHSYLDGFDKNWERRLQTFRERSSYRTDGMVAENVPLLVLYSGTS